MKKMFKITFLILSIYTTGIFSDDLQCKFHDNGVEFNFRTIPGYTCEISYLRPSPPNKSNAIFGTHLTSKTTDGVKIISYPSFSTEFEGNIQSDLPTICQVFTNLEGIQIRTANLSIFNENLVKDCKYLNFVDLYKCKIQEISENSLSKFTNMKYLSFAANKLTTLHENLFANHKELLALSLQENEITFLPPNIFKSLYKLQHLRLDANKIQSLAPGLFSNLHNLERLDLYNNEISELPKGVFSSLVNLKELWFYRNKLKEINSDSFGIHRRLTHIYLYENFIDAVDEKFIDNTAVEELNMEGNVCDKDFIKTRADMKEKLRNCFSNFRSRYQSALVPLRPYQETTIQILTPITERPNFQGSCGRSKIGQGNIIGGKLINRGAFPWIAALVKSKGDFFCGGTIISDKKILTAAHCLQEKGSQSPILSRDFKALLGVHDLNERFEVGIKVSVVQKLHIHPDWNPRSQSFDADIAVLVIERKIGFDNYIQPICFSTAGVNIGVSSNGVVVGFGRSEDDSKVHENIPKIVDTPIHDNIDCFLKHYELSKLSSKRTFCGGLANGVGVCNGDSGSGLVVLHGGSYYLRGIVSSSLRGYKYGCDVDSYSVFTDVLQYNDWVNGIDVNANFYDTIYQLSIESRPIWT